MAKRTTVKPASGRATKKASAGQKPIKPGQKPAKAGRKPTKKKSTKESTGEESTTEEKIKEAACKLFTQKGFAATRTRDIAEEAGINLALLNYYFRSKQKLFDLIMMENFRQFLQGITVHFLNEQLTVAERVERVVVAYIDFLTDSPDLPLFILNEMRGNSSKFMARIREEAGPVRSKFLVQMQEAHRSGKSALDPFHFIANLIGLTVFPFVGRPALQRVTGVSDDKFNAFMQERKKLVPEWIRLMMAV